MYFIYVSNKSLRSILVIFYLYLLYMEKSVAIIFILVAQSFDS